MSASLAGLLFLSLIKILATLQGDGLRGILATLAALAAEEFFCFLPGLPATLRGDGLRAILVALAALMVE